MLMSLLELVFPHSILTWHPAFLSLTRTHLLHHMSCASDAHKHRPVKLPKGGAAADGVCESCMMPVLPGLALVHRQWCAVESLSSFPLANLEHVCAEVWMCSSVFVNVARCVWDVRLAELAGQIGWLFTLS